MMYFRGMLSRIWWSLGVLALTFLLVQPGHAQDAPISRLVQLNIDLWPEYDRSAMLVIYRMQLNPADVPGILSVRIPQRAGRPYAVAMAASPQSDLLNATYEYQPATGSPWAWVHINAPQPYIQLEYYDPALEKDGQKRSYRFVWPGDLEVQRVVVEVQRPWNAQDLITQPPLSPVGATTAGIELYERDFGALDAGESLEILVEYTKPDDLLTIQHLQAVQPGGPGSPDMSGAVATPVDSGRGLGALEGTLIILGLVLLAGTGWYWWRQRREGRSLSVRLPKPERGQTTGSRARFCPQCGTRSLPGARFCHQCGSPLP